MAFRSRSSSFSAFMLVSLAYASACAPAPSSLAESDAPVTLIYSNATGWRYEFNTSTEQAEIAAAVRSCTAPCTVAQTTDYSGKLTYVTCTCPQPPANPTPTRVSRWKVWEWWSYIFYSSSGSTSVASGHSDEKSLYRIVAASEDGACIARIDLETLEETKLTEDLGRLGSLVETAQGTLITADSGIAGKQNGIVYELSPEKGEVVERPAFGALAFGDIARADRDYYFVDRSENSALFKFTPDQEDSLESGQLFVLEAEAGTWIPLDRDQVQVDARAVAEESTIPAVFAGVTKLTVSSGALVMAMPSENRLVAVHLYDENAEVQELAGELEAPMNVTAMPSGNLLVGSADLEREWLIERSEEGGFGEPVELSRSQSEKLATFEKSGRSTRSAKE